MASVARHRHPPKSQAKKSTATAAASTVLSRALQSAIVNGSRQDFTRLCETAAASTDELAQALLTWRVARVIQYPLSVRQEAVRKLGAPPPSPEPLDALQYTLLLQKGALATAMLEFLQQHGARDALRVFVNRRWGGGSSNTALHLACFWNMPRLVRLLLDLGADSTARNAQLVAPADCCRSAPHGNDCRAMLLPCALPPEKHHHHHPARPSMLLKKAMEQQHQQHPYATMVGSLPQPLPPPAPAAIPSEYFATAALSSTSTSSSVLSADDSSTCWTPPPSPMRRRMCFSPPVHALHDTPQSTASSKHVRFDPQTLMHDACLRGNLPELLHWLKEGHHVATYGAQNRSLLQIAVIFGHDQLVSHLVEDTRDQVDHCDSQGWTAMHYAAKHGRWRALEHLAPVGNVHARTPDGCTIYDCPKTHVDKQKCRAVVERALRRHHLATRPNPTAA